MSGSCYGFRFRSPHQALEAFKDVQMAICCGSLAVWKRILLLHSLQNQLAYKTCDVLRRSDNAYGSRANVNTPHHGQDSQENSRDSVDPRVSAWPGCAKFTHLVPPVLPEAARSPEKFEMLAKHIPDVRPCTQTHVFTRVSMPALSTVCHSYFVHVSMSICLSEPQITARVWKPSGSW